MQVPDHLIPLMRELAEECLARALATVRLIEAHRSAEHKDAIDARARLREAEDLVAAVGPRSRAVA